jgi:hypothetical protein
LRDETVKEGQNYRYFLGLIVFDGFEKCSKPRKGVLG